MENRIAITGLGIISALGTTLEHHINSLQNGTSGISPLQKIDSVHANLLNVGEVASTNDQLAEKLHIGRGHNFTRTALLGSYAAAEAMAMTKNRGLADTRIGLISATTVGGMDKTEIHFKELRSNLASQKYIYSHHAGDSTQKIASLLKIAGFTTTISTACSSAANAIMLGARLLKAGKLDRVVVGGTDSLSKFTINGFKSLMLLSDSHCAPFDANRNGLNLGEAAAYLVLERENDSKKEQILGYVSGYGNANDAYHQTASSETGEGAYLAMQKALQSAGLQPSQIDYVNAHGTATANNDLSESVALQRIFNDSVPNFSSTKGYTGHTLAAAGAVEAIFSVLMLKEGFIAPNLNFSMPIPETQLIPVTTLQKKPLQSVLSNSFGFGGNCTSLIFGKA